MSIKQESELLGMQKASEAVAFTLKEMRNFAKPVCLQKSWTSTEVRS